MFRSARLIGHLQTGNLHGFHPALLLQGPNCAGPAWRMLGQCFGADWLFFSAKVGQQGCLARGAGEGSRVCGVAGGCRAPAL